jgi:short-chain Z-isoprenyl diphosphate synthase
VLKNLLYRVYERQLLNNVRRRHIPRHVGLIQDGNRRYAREAGLSEPSEGYRLASLKTEEVLTWCAGLGIPVVTLWWLSTENLTREPHEVAAILRVIEKKMVEWMQGGLVQQLRIRVRPIGKLELLPASTLQVLRDIDSATQHHDQMLVNVGVGYGGRQEIVDAIRRYLEERFMRPHSPEEILQDLTPEALDKFLYTYDCPDPDLIIRTSGEVRLSGFMLWQSAYSEFYFCDAIGQRSGKFIFSEPYGVISGASGGLDTRYPS